MNATDKIKNQPRFETDECPICLSKISIEVSTLCGHIFCGSILDYFVKFIPQVIA